MEGGAPRGPGGRTKTDLRAGRLSAMTPPAAGKMQRATTDAEQDFLLGAKDLQPLPAPAPGKMAE